MVRTNSIADLIDDTFKCLSVSFNYMSRGCQLTVEGSHIDTLTENGWYGRNGDGCEYAELHLV